METFTLPVLIFGFIRLLVILAAIAGFFATVICLPIGIILFLAKREKIKKSEESEKKKFYKLVKLLIFSGPCTLVAAFIIWAIIALIDVFFGTNVLSFTTPPL